MMTVSLVLIRRVALLAVLATANPAAAQTVSFDPPQSIEIEPGLLSVTFKRDVAQSTAVEYLTRLGLTVEQITFPDIIVTANSNAPFTDAQIAALIEHPRVKEADRYSVPIPPEHYVTVTFEPNIDPEEAEWIVEDWRDARVVGVTALPNEVVVRVRPGQEEAAIESIRQDTGVLDVTYVAALQGGE